MKKTFTFILLIILAFSLTGCGKNGGNGNNGSREVRRPDFGQPESRPDITGIVKSITGNEVTVIKFDRPEMGEGEDWQGMQGDEEENEDRPQVNPGATFGGGSGGHGGGFGGMGGSRGGSQNGGDSGAFLEMMKEMSTGEEKITIQVGIRMLKFSEGEGADREAIEATLSDIKVDKMISVWLDDSVTDRNLASFVLITR